MLFSFSLAGYLSAVDIALISRGLGTAIPSCPQTAEWLDADVAPAANHVSWADDYAHLQRAESEADLHATVRASAILHLELATSIGMELTFAADKSAVLLPSLCARDPEPCSAHNPKGLPWLPPA